MKHWPIKSLSEVAQVAAGDPAPQRSEDFADDGFPFVRMQDVGRFGQTTNLIETRDKVSILASSKLKRFPVGSILVPKSGASIRLNHRAILGVEANVVSHLAVIVPNALLNNRFAYYWLCGIDLSGVAHDADLPSMKTSELAKLQIPIPPLAEQERIVKLLDEADELRKLRAKADSRTTTLIHALFQEMFGDPLGGKHKWPEVRFEEVTRRITYGFTSPMKHLESGIPIITCKNVLDGKIDFENVHYADNDEFAALTAKSKPQQNDILITKDGTIGRCAVVDVNFPICINQSVTLVQLKLDKVMPVYLTSYIIYPSVKAFLNGMGKGQALKHLQITELAKMPIPLPPLALQNEFAQRVNEIRELEARQAASRTRLDALFQSMLHRAFNGEL